MNRQGMPEGDFSKWTPLQDLAEQIVRWTNDPSTIEHGKMYLVETADGVTKYTWEGYLVDSNTVDGATKWYYSWGSGWQPLWRRLQQVKFHIKTVILLNEEQIYSWAEYNDISAQRLYWYGEHKGGK
jgi:hypothetical protein